MTIENTSLRYAIGYMTATVIKFVLRLMRIYNILTAPRMSFNRCLNDLEYNCTTGIRQGLTRITKQTEM